MGLIEKMLGKMRFKDDLPTDVIPKPVTRTPEEIQKQRFTTDMERVIQDMYERGIKITKNNPTQSLLNELYTMTQQQNISKEQIDIYLGIINKIENMPEEEKIELSKKLEDELEYEQEEGDQER